MQFNARETATKDIYKKTCIDEQTIEWALQMNREPNGPEQRNARTHALHFAVNGIFQQRERERERNVKMQWRSNRVCKACSARGPIAVWGPDEPCVGSVTITTYSSTDGAKTCLVQTYLDTNDMRLQLVECSLLRAVSSRVRVRFTVWKISCYANVFALL